MTFFRNRMFLEGIALGGICGIIIGSIIAFTLGESSVEAVRRLMDERFPRRRSVPFKYLSQ
jgi:divalent metal cation (Fe/Co/Zn/Cd) transporter